MGQPRWVTNTLRSESLAINRQLHELRDQLTIRTNEIEALEARITNANLDLQERACAALANVLCSCHLERPDPDAEQKEPEEPEEADRG